MDQSRETLRFGGAIVFLASFVLMTLELVAGRVMAPYLGVSIFTWTAIIGVILAGISIGTFPASLYVGITTIDSIPHLAPHVYYGPALTSAQELSAMPMATASVKPARLTATATA